MFWMLAMQAATATAAPPPERFSILAQACERQPGGDIVVCADPQTGARLPRPDDRAPDGPAPSNPYVTGTGALAAEATPCAAQMKGCTVGFGQPVIAAVAGALVDGVQSVLAKKPDKTGRVPIPLDPQVPLPGYDVR